MSSPFIRAWARKVLTSSKNTHWCTPQCVLDRVRKMGRIALDPCGNKESIVNAQKTLYGLPESDGLRADWQVITDIYGPGLVFCNPPYGREIKYWMAKCADEWSLKNTEIIALVPARVDTLWWYKSVYGTASLVCFWSGRLTFLGAPHPAPFPSAVVYYGDRKDAFCAAFGDAGWITEVGR